MNNKTNLNFVYFVLLLVQILFGVNFVASKIIVQNMEPMAWAFIRFLIAGFFLILFTKLLFNQRPKYSINYFLKINLFAFLGFTLGQVGMLEGLRLTTSINTSIITSTIPIWTLVYLIFKKLEPIGWSKIVGFGIAFIGVLVIRDLSSFTFSNETFLGDLLVLGGAISSGIFIAICRPFLLENNHFYASSWMFLFGALQIGILSLFMGVSFELKSHSIEMGAAMGYSAVAATLLTYFLSNWALTKTHSGSVAIFIYFQPIVAAIVAYFYLGENISWRTFLSSALILTGFFVVAVLSRKKIPAEDQQRDHTS